MCAIRMNRRWMIFSWHAKHDEAVARGEASIHDTLKEGDLMLFTDSDLGIEGSIIIDTLIIKEGEDMIPKYTMTLREEKGCWIA